MAEPEYKDSDDKEVSKNSSHEEILRVARERFNVAEEAEGEIRKAALEDLEFRSGKQWPEKAKADRDSKNRPSLVINRIPQFIRQITNDQRQNRPSIKVSPVDEYADVETAKILQGLIRHIENNSNADVAYDTAFEGAVIKGFGYFRIITDYVDPKSFEQEILIKRIRNHFQVYLDPHSKEPDGSDANWGFIFEDVPKDDYKAEYKDSKLNKSGGWEALGEVAPGWMTDKTCRVAEYFYKDYKTVNLIQLSTGETVEESELTTLYPEGAPLGMSIVNQRSTQVPVIKWCKINGNEIIQETEWPGRWIPIIPVYGDELDINGKRVLEGVVRHAKDSQRMYNYWASTETESIALAPKAPWIVAEGQIPKEYAQMWATANTDSHSTLIYKPTSLNGTPVSPPVRNAYEPAVQAITNARMQASEDLKATTGIYDAALGARGNESSGVAIQRRNAQSQTSNFHFVDNLTRSLRHAGRILVDLIPKIYDTPRTARIIGENDEEKIVPINQFFEEFGKQKQFQLSAGKYDVTVATGPSYATKRQEALASMLDLTKAYPQVAQIAGDLMVKNMDWPGAIEISERLKKTLPPGMADDPKDPKNQQAPDPAMQQEMQQMGQMIEALTGQLNEAKEMLRNKTVELESKERIEFAKLEQQATIKLAELESKEATEILYHQMQELNQRLNLLNVNSTFPQPVYEEPNKNGSGAVGAEYPQEEQQPTGGFPPGQPMEY